MDLDLSQTFPGTHPGIPRVPRLDRDIEHATFARPFSVMSVPGNINTAPPPSSFDDNAEFYEESRWQKFRRRLVEEPLIPLGCALTCWALLEA